MMMHGTMNVNTGGKANSTCTGQVLDLYWPGGRLVRSQSGAGLWIAHVHR
jgi:hypothetical protein